MHDLLRIQAPNGGIDALPELGLVHESGWNAHKSIMSRSAARRLRLVAKDLVTVTERTRPKNALPAEVALSPTRWLFLSTAGSTGRLPPPQAVSITMNMTRSRLCESRDSI